MSAHLLRIRLFQRHLGLGLVWDWIHWHTSPRTRSPSSRHPPFTLHYPFPPRSLVCGGQTSPRKPRLVVSHSTCPPLSPSPHAHSFVLGTAVINTHTISHDVEASIHHLIPKITEKRFKTYCYPPLLRPISATPSSVTVASLVCPPRLTVPFRVLHQHPLRFAAAVARGQRAQCPWFC
jgi:hypothetical protein